MEGLFVTGTDTGVGKTLVTAALLHLYGERGERVAGCKPVVSGATETDAGIVYDDVEVLCRHSRPSLEARECNRHAFPEPIAPHWAASLHGVEIDVDELAAHVRRLAGRYDRILVEGAGGCLVPLGSGKTFLDLASAIALPVLLVVGLKLGAINHALLSAEAIRRRGLVLAGWVGNFNGPLVPPGTIEGLSAYLDAPCWGLPPPMPHPTVAEMASHIRMA